MAGAINEFSQNVSLSEDGSIVEITVTNNGLTNIESPFVVTAVYVDGTNQYVRTLEVAELDAAAQVKLSLSINGVASYNEQNLHVGIGFIHTTT